MQPIEVFLAALERHGCEPKPCGQSQWAARCKAHDDHSPSLSVGVGADGRVLVTCHTGCEAEAVAAAVGLTMRDLAPPSHNGATARTKEYPIRDVAGVVIAYHGRVDRPDGTKTFYWRLPSGTRGLGGRPASSLPLYGSERLNAIPDGSTVYLTEGEKAADALLAQGLFAVGTVTGAKNAPNAEVLKSLVRFHVVCWPDADTLGADHLDKCSRTLLGVGGRPRTLHWKEAREGDDAFDFFARGGTREQLDAMVQAARPAATVAPPAPDDRRPAVICLADVQPRAVEYLWPTYIPSGKLTLLDGDPEVGKTFLAIAIATAVTLGLPLPGDDA